MEDKKELVRQMLEFIGDDPSREGLIDTPKRVVNMWKEIFRGYDESQKPIITTFNNGTDGIVYDQMVIDEGDFYSHCEHHAVSFFGKYWFAYIPHPNGKILGLSKVARIVDYYSAKLQTQERLVKEIVDELWMALSKDKEPLGMALVMRGKHLCKSMRGAKKDGIMTTSNMRGAFKDYPETRAEFLQFVNGGK